MLEREFKVKTFWSSKSKGDAFLNSKSHKVSFENKESLTVSAAKEFKGDKTKHKSVWNKQHISETNKHTVLL